LGKFFYGWTEFKTLKGESFRRSREGAMNTDSSHRIRALVLALLLMGIVVGVARPAEDYNDARQAMVTLQLKHRDITDPRVLAAMGMVPRHRFVPGDLASRAWRHSRPSARRPSPSPILWR
jgi:hypothetical protein